MANIPSEHLKQYKEVLIRKYGLKGLDILLPHPTVHDPYGGIGVIIIYTEKGPFSLKYDIEALKRAGDWRSLYTSMVENCIQMYIDTPSIETRAGEDKEPLFIL